MSTRERNDSANLDRFDGNEIWIGDQDVENELKLEFLPARGYDPSDDSDYESDSDDERSWEDEDEEIEEGDEDDEDDY